MLTDSGPSESGEGARTQEEGEGWRAIFCSYMRRSARESSSPRETGLRGSKRAMPVLNQIFSGLETLRLSASKEALSRWEIASQL